MNELFGTLSDGTPVHRWTLRRAGVRVRVLTYGGIVQSVEVPDREGRAGDVVLGFPDLDGYLAHPEPYLGALVGRYANRIAGGRSHWTGGRTRSNRTTGRTRCTAEPADSTGGCGTRPRSSTGCG
ncbi:hypothetical protein SUDANB52_05654 [Streptomyces sp. SudanB52_2052]